MKLIGERAVLKAIIAVSWGGIFFGVLAVLIGILKYSEILKPVIEDAQGFTTDPASYLVAGVTVLTVSLLLRWKAKSSQK